jgi:hypothetical protein
MSDLENTFVRFQYAIANALMQWQFIERNIFRIFIESVDCRSTTYVAAAYHATINFNLKLRMTNEVLELRLMGDPLLEEWKTLKSRLEKRAKSRNELVHWFHESRPINSHGETIHTWRLTPNFYDPRPTKRPLLSEKDIERIRIQFLRLGGDLDEFRAKMRIFLASQVKSPSV